MVREYIEDITLIMANGIVEYYVELTDEKSDVNDQKKMREFRFVYLTDH
jgi:hypothetical protein